MGLAPLDIKDWIEPDDDLNCRLAEKYRLLENQYNDVFRELPESLRGQREVLDLLVDYLTTRYPNIYQFSSNQIHIIVNGCSFDLNNNNMPALDLAGRLVEEDLCLMSPTPGGYVLTAASVCSPTIWKLSDKIGKTLTAIHEPIDGLEAKIGHRMRHFFDHLTPEKSYWRNNWFIVDNTDLFRPYDEINWDNAFDGLTADNAGEKLFIRCERQTLRRLPVSQDVLFTIKVYIDRIDVLTQYPQMAADMKLAFLDMIDSEREMRLFQDFRDPLFKYLDAIIAKAHIS